MLLSDIRKPIFEKENMFGPASHKQVASEILGGESQAELARKTGLSKPDVCRLLRKPSGEGENQKHRGLSTNKVRKLKRAGIPSKKITDLVN